MKTIYVCTNCGSDNIRSTENDNECPENGWCCDEEEKVVVTSVEVEDDAKVIGFQVWGEEGSPNEGEIHPDMDASFCVYNLKQALQMIAEGRGLLTNWRLLTIWEGDVEEPTMMFSGDPRS